MEEFADRLHLENYTLNIFNDTTEEAGILNFAESIHADLIGYPRPFRIHSPIDWEEFQRAL